MEKNKSAKGLDRAAVEKVAELARLELSEAELTAIAGQLAAVLANFELLQTVDTKGVEPLITPTDLKLRLREDEVVAVTNIEPFLANAPARSGDLFKVPPVVGGD